MIYRITFGINGMGKGWAETHAMINSSNNPKDLIPTLVDLANKRAQMLGREFTIVAIRASRYATEAGERRRGSFIEKTNIKNSGTTQAFAAEPAEVAYIVRGSAEPSILNPAFDANQNQSFLGAPLDVCVDNAGVVDRGKGGLDAAFQSWRATMVAIQMGWLASQTIFDGDLATITQNPSGTVNLVTQANVTPALTVGQLYKCRIRGVNNGVSPLNDEAIVRCVDATHLNTKQTIGIPTAQSGGAIRIYKQVQPFVDYGDLSLNATVGKHSRGRPFGSTPGRAKRRIRG